MMLQPNQLKAIEDINNAGQELPVPLAAALLADHQSLAFLQKANLDQIAKLQSQKASLTSERDETLRLRREIELEIDTRVATRTELLQTEAKEAKRVAHNCESDRDYYKKQTDHVGALLARTLSKAEQAISLLRAALEQQHSNASWMRRIWWQRTVKRTLSQVDQLIPASELDSWRGRDEADRTDKCLSKTQT